MSSKDEDGAISGKDQPPGAGGQADPAGQAAAMAAEAQASAPPDGSSQSAAQDNNEEPRFDHIGVLGHVGWLLAREAETRDLFITDLEWRVMPPVALNQFKLWHAEDPNGGGRRPVAFASWAYVGERQKQRIEAGNKRLSPGEWKSGDHKVLIDVIAPFGGKDKILEEIGG